MRNNTGHQLRLLFFLLLLPGFVMAEDAGSRGLSFLKIDVDSRAAGMGGAYTALTSDASSAYWNPAGLASAEKASLILMHNEWLADLSQEFAAFQFKRGKHNMAVALNILRIPGIEIRGAVPTEQPDGKVEALNMSTTLSYATIVKEKWQVGINLKYLFERYYLVNGKGYAFDFGVQHRSLIDGLNVGMVVQNIGQMTTLAEERTPLPSMIRAGAAYRLPFLTSLLAAIELQHIFNETNHLRVGADYRLHPVITLRTGFISGLEDPAITAGLSVNYQDYHFDYAFVPFDYDLGNSHRLTFGIHF